MTLEVTRTTEKDDRTYFWCNDILIFDSPTKVPDDFQVSQEAWD